MGNNIFFWALSKKIIYLFDFRKNDYAIFNLFYLCIVAFCSFTLGKLFKDNAIEPFVMMVSCTLYVFYGLIAISKKDFRNRIVNKFYPILKVKQYIIDFFLCFFDYYFFLFLFSGIGLFFSIENIRFIDFILFFIGLLNTYALLNILMPFSSNTIYLFIVKAIVFLLNIYFGSIIIFNYSQYWAEYLIFSFLLNTAIGYFFFLYTYNINSEQKEIEKPVIIFKKQKALAYIKPFYYCKTAKSKMIGTFFIKFFICFAYLNIIEGKVIYNSFEFNVFSPFLFTPYFYFRYFANIWGINKDPWLIINLSPNCTRSLISFFINQLLFFIFIDFLFIIGFFVYFSIWEIKEIVLYLLSLMVFIPVSLICSILFPVKVSKKIFYNQETASSTTIVSFILYFLYSFSFFTSIYFAISVLILSFLFSYYYFMNLYNNYGYYRHKIYNLLFK